jgi:hypothetical protein
MRMETLAESNEGNLPDEDEAENQSRNQRSYALHDAATSKGRQRDDNEAKYQEERTLRGSHRQDH